ncbi:hypothetical protein DERP_004819 [Dermatophagoides pteronyssinus]|uniref:Uncharacterized protein n=1 Tax=Dermatophagoides pteronyssinus TaxID=6956 RepID=A0ABQ8JT52_DERPT|nr:hypothetical protein DERP_004819 [Dermatophagoides pteronyssinus]
MVMKYVRNYRKDLIGKKHQSYYYLFNVYLYVNIEIFIYRCSVHVYDIDSIHDDADDSNIDELYVVQNIR